jgi:hypothetical protein
MQLSQGIEEIESHETENDTLTTFPTAPSLLNCL